MVKAWYMDDGDGSQCYKTDPPAFITVEDLYKKAGVEYMWVNSDTWESNQKYLDMKTNRNYDYEDVMEISKAAQDDYEERLKNQYSREHVHDDEESRFIIGGSAYFDVRDKDNRWIRIHVTKNDLLMLPTGIYHRLYPDNTHCVRMIRMFVGSPVWKGFFRDEEEDIPAHKKYLTRMAAMES